jgi:hypothetical protein
MSLFSLIRNRKKSFSPTRRDPVRRRSLARAHNRSSRSKNPFRFRLLTWVFLFFAAIAIPTVIKNTFFPTQTEAAWWNEGWLYRQRVDITNNESTDLTDFQVKITLDTATLITAGKLQSDCDDIRITDHQGNEIPFWVEENDPGCNDTATEIWVKIPTLPADDGVVYLYYGNASSSISPHHKGDQVFNFFDSFNGDLSKWDSASGGNTSVASGVLTWIISGGGHRYMPSTTSSMSDMTDMMVETRTRYITGSTGTIYWGVGSRFNSTLNRYAGAAYPSAGGGSRCDIRVNTAGAAFDDCTTSIDTWYVIGSQAMGTGIAVFQDRVNIASTTNGDYAAGRVNLEGYGSGGTATYEYDWVLARKITANEPTTAQGSEEVTPGPIAYWKFDEGADNTCSGGTNDVCDSSGQGKDGTLTGSPTWQSEDQCVSGKCLFYDGANNDYVSVADSGSNDLLDMDTRSFSISYWIQPLDYTYPKTTFAIKDGDAPYAAGAGHEGWSISDNYTATGTRVTFNDGTNLVNGLLTFNTGSQPPDLLNKWSHFTFVFDRTGGTISVYIDGIKQTSEVDISSVTGSVSNATSLMVGFGTGWKFHGFLDEFKIYPYARTADEAKQDFLAGGSPSGVGAVLGSQDQTFMSEGLVGYWKMDEASANTCSGGVNDSCDSSGNGNDGAWSGTVTSGSGKFGNSGLFSSSGSINMGDISNFNMGTDDMTISVWAKRPDNGISQELVNKGILGSGDIGDSYTLYIQSTGVLKSMFSVGGSNAIFNGSTVVDDNEWHHIVAVFDRDGNLSNYIDGNLDSSVSISDHNGVDLSNSYDFLVGGSRAYAGSIDETRIYNRALSAGEIADLYNWAPGPVGHWKMDEGSGTNAYDTSGNESVGVITGASWSTGKFGKALNFNGSSDIIGISNNDSLQNSQGTMEAWIKTSDAGSGYRGVFVKSNAYGMFLNGNQFGLYDYGGGLGWEGSGVSPNDGQWHHLAISYNSGVANGTTFYVDGIARGTTATTILNQTSSPNIGYGSGTGQYFTGLIDDVRIYNYARTAAQINQDMGAAGSSILGSSTLPDPVVHWRFDEGFGQAAHNSSSESDYDGTLSASIPSTSGKMGKALDFDDTANHYIQSDTALTLSGDQSYSAWIKPSNISGLKGIVTTHDHSTYSNIGFNMYGNKLSVSIGYTDNTREYLSKQSTQNIPTDEWTHVTLVYKSQENSIAIYINGELNSSWVLTKTVDFTEEKILVGQWSNTYLSGYKYDGLIDEVKIYNSALTPEQITLDMNAGASLNYSTGSDTADDVVDGAGNPPVAEWNFDENTGTSANDISGNGNTGTLTGAGWKAGKYGTALEVNASTNRAVVTDTNALDITTAYTVETWVKFNEVSARHHTLIDKGSGGTDGWRLLAESTGAIYLQIKNSSSWYTGATTGSGYYVADTWYHISYTWDGTTAYLYINGAQVDSSAIAQNNLVANGADLVLGNWGTSGNDGNAHNGLLDNTKIYDYARTPAQVAYDYNGGLPVAHWRFDECQGSTANDSSSNGNSGTINEPGAGTNTSIGTCSGSAGEMWADGESGKFNSSLEFDGTDDYVDASNDSSLNFSKTSPFSISTWIKYNGSKIGENHIISRHSLSGTQGGYVLLYNQSAQQIAFDLINDSGNQYYSNYAYTLDTNWHHLTGVYDGSGNRNGIKLYIDGNLVSTGSNLAIAGDITLSSSLHIGKAAYSSSQYFGGQIDDARIYNYALSANQVKNVMNGNASVQFGN